MGRQGFAKLRHVDTDRTMELRKVYGIENPADSFTKHFTSAAKGEDVLLQQRSCELHKM